MAACPGAMYRSLNASAVAARPEAPWRRVVRACAGGRGTALRTAALPAGGALWEAGGGFFATADPDIAAQRARAATDRATTRVGRDVRPLSRRSAVKVVWSMLPPGLGS